MILYKLRLYFIFIFSLLSFTAVAEIIFNEAFETPISSKNLRTNKSSVNFHGWSTGKILASYEFKEGEILINNTTNNRGIHSNSTQIFSKLGDSYTVSTEFNNLSLVIPKNFINHPHSIFVGFASANTDLKYFNSLVDIKNNTNEANSNEDCIYIAWDNNIPNLSQGILKLYAKNAKNLNKLMIRPSKFWVNNSNYKLDLTLTLLDLDKALFEVQYKVTHLNSIDGDKVLTSESGQFNSPQILQYGVKASIYAKRALATNHFDNLDNLIVSHEVKSVPNPAEIKKAEEAKKLAAEKKAKADKLAAEKKAQELKAKEDAKKKADAQAKKVAENKAKKLKEEADKKKAEAAKLAAEKKAQELKAKEDAKKTATEATKTNTSTMTWRVETVANPQSTNFLTKDGFLLTPINFVKNPSKKLKLDDILFNPTSKIVNRYFRIRNLSMTADNFHPNSSSILNEGIYSNNKKSITISLTNLHVGKTYYLDLIIANNRDSEKTKTFSIDGTPYTSINYPNNDQFLILKCEFVVTQVIQQIKLTATKDQFIQLNALQLRSKDELIKPLTRAELFKKFEKLPRITNLEASSELLSDFTGKLTKQGKLLAAIDYAGINSDEPVLFDGVPFRARSTALSRHFDLSFFNNYHHLFAVKESKSSILNCALWAKEFDACIVLKDLEIGKTYHIDYIYNDNRPPMKDRTISFDQGKTYSIMSKPDASFLAKLTFKATHTSMALELKTKHRDALQVNAIQLRVSD